MEGMSFVEAVLAWVALRMDVGFRMLGLAYIAGVGPSIGPRPILISFPLIKCASRRNCGSGGSWEDRESLVRLCSG